jgi:hypothetical protein
VTPATCPDRLDAYVDVTVEGGNPGLHNYSWSWLPAGSKETVPIPMPGVEGFEDIMTLPGTFWLTVTDATGCVATLEVNVTSPPPLKVAPVETDAPCAIPDAFPDSPIPADSRTVDLGVSGGTLPYEFTWSNGALGLDRGCTLSRWVVTVTDANACKVTVKSADVPLPIKVHSKAPSCFGVCDANLTVRVRGGEPPYEYLWSTGATTSEIQSICAGKYSVTVTDAGGRRAALNHTMGAPSR